MPAPINYTQGFTNPMDAIQQTLQIGGMLGQLGQVRDQREAAQQAAIAKAQRDQEIKEAFDAAQANPTYENYRRLADMSPPEQAKSFRESWDMLDQAQQRQALNDTVSIYAAFDSQQPEFALNLLSDRVEAAKNAKDMESAQRYQAMIDLANTGPEGIKAVKHMFGMSITGMTGGKEAMEALGKFGEEQRAAAAEPDVINQRLADLDYTEAQTDKIRADIRKLDAEAADALLRMEENKAGNIYDPKDIAEAENSLRKEYDGRQKQFKQIENYYDIIQNAEDTGIGDVALIFTYMKILDPTSVVREGEVATASNAGGVPSAIMSAYNKALGTGKIDDNVRNQIRSQSKKIYLIAETNAAKDTAFFTDIANRRGLNVENIIYREPAAQAAAGTTAAPAPVADIGALKAYIVSRFPNEAARINSLDLAGLQAEYPKSVASYKPAGAPAAAAATVPQTVVEADF